MINWTAVVVFFNSNFFVGLSTILTIAGAVYLFFRKNRTDKQQIAILLINEIRNAENAIQTLKDRPKGLDLPEIEILPQNSWNKYSYLFTKDLDQDDIYAINKFYSDAEQANYVVSQGNSMELFLLEVRQRSDAIHHKIIDLVDKNKDKEIEKIMNDFSSKLLNPKGLYHYSPQGFSDKLDSTLQNIQFILEASAGTKLKKISTRRIFI